jgi:hypothetical protein
MDDIAQMRAELAQLRAELSTLRGGGAGERCSERPPGGSATSRRQLLTLAGASAAGVAGVALAGGRPVAAADPNDVVKNVANPVVAATTLNGSMPTPIFGLFNNATSGEASALYMFSQSAGAPTLRGDNDAIGGVALAGNAPGGRDVLARGSGRIAMDDHVFGGTNQYAPGEFHQSGGTFYAMVSPTVRRVIASPGSAGALTAIEPRRVYDSRSPAPSPGRLGAGESRVISVANGRDLQSGGVNVADIVPSDATVIVFNLTVINTASSGFLSITPAPTTVISASTINWIGDAQVAANSSMVGLAGTREVRVHCGGVGSTDFTLDILGYHR